MFGSSGLVTDADNDEADTDDSNDAFEAQLPQIKLMAAAAFIIAARVYPKERKGGDVCGVVTLVLLTSLLLSAETSASDNIVGYLMLLMGHLILVLAEETNLIGLLLAMQEEKAAGLIILDDGNDDKTENASVPRI